MCDLHFDVLHTCNSEMSTDMRCCVLEKAELLKRDVNNLGYNSNVSSIRTFSSKIKRSTFVCAYDYKEWQIENKTEKKLFREKSKMIKLKQRGGMFCQSDSLKIWLHLIEWLVIKCAYLMYVVYACLCARMWLCVSSSWHRSICILFILFMCK